MSSHYSPNEILRYSDGQMSKAMTEHFADCSNCRDLLAGCGMTAEVKELEGEELRAAVEKVMKVIR